MGVYIVPYAVHLALGLLIMPPYGKGIPFGPEEYGHEFEKVRPDHYFKAVAPASELAHHIPYEASHPVILAPEPDDGPILILRLIHGQREV